MEKINLHMSDEIVETFITKKAAMHHIKNADYAAETFPTMWPDNGWHYNMEKRYLLVRMGQSPSGDYPMETIGYIHEDLRDDELFWSCLPDDEGVMEVLEPENEPHAGITCEYTGLVISEPWYFVEFAVDPTACDSEGNDFYQGAENALHELLNQAEQYAIDGWSCDHIGLEAVVTFGGTDRPLTLTHTLLANRLGDEVHILMKVDDMSERSNEKQYTDLVSAWDDPSDEEDSGRYRFVDMAKKFFHIDKSDMHITYRDVSGSLVMRQGEYARRFGTISRFNG